MAVTKNSSKRPTRQPDIARHLLDLTEQRYRPERAAYVEEEWNRIYRDTHQGNELAIDDAALLASLGKSIASEKAEHARAAELLRGFFQHPQIDSADSYDWAFLRGCLAGSLLDIGDEAGFIEVMRSVTNHSDRWVSLHGLRHSRVILMGWCEEGREPADVASEAMTEFVAELASQWRKRKRYSTRRRLPNPATYAEIEAELQSLP